MPRQRIDSTSVVDAAIELVDEDGLDELALARVAGELGVQSSALYNHVDGLEGLRYAVAIRATHNLAEALRDAAVARAGDDAIAAVATAYRRFASDHPGQYASTLLPPTDPADALVTSHQQIVDILARIMHSYGLDGDDAVHAARAVRSAIHGFVALEATDAFVYPQPAAESFDRLVELVLVGLHHQTAA